LPIRQSQENDAKGLFKTAVRDNNPVLFVEGQLLYNEKGMVPEEDYLIPFAQANTIQEGTDVSIICWGPAVIDAVTAAGQLAAEGISAEVLDLRTLKPLDQEAILKSARKTGNVIIVHEACKRGGVGGDIAAMIMEEAYDDLDGPVMRVCGKDTPIPYNLELEKVCIPTVEDIIEAVIKIT